MESISSVASSTFQRMSTRLEWEVMVESNYARRASIRLAGRRRVHWTMSQDWGHGWWPFNSSSQSRGGNDQRKKTAKSTQPEGPGSSLRQPDKVSTRMGKGQVDLLLESNGWIKSSKITWHRSPFHPMVRSSRGSAKTGARGAGYFMMLELGQDPHKHRKWGFTGMQER